jgi:hypothetical protein
MVSCENACSSSHVHVHGEGVAFGLTNMKLANMEPMNMKLEQRSYIYIHVRNSTNPTYPTVTFGRGTRNLSKAIALPRSLLRTDIECWCVLVVLAACSAS